MKKFLFVVITCNRFLYLQNCVKSIIKFVGLDDIDLLIIDNNTTEKGIDNYFSSLPPEVKIKVFKKNEMGELARAMNYAITYCKRNHNQYINFIQDDCQYIMKHQNLLQWMDDAFIKYKKVGQLQTFLRSKNSKRKIGKLKLVNVNGINWFILRKPPYDIGCTRYAVYNGVKYPPLGINGRNSGENWMARRLKKKGWYRMLLAASNMVQMGLVKSRHTKNKGNYFSPPKNFYYKPLNQKEREELIYRASKGEFGLGDKFVIRHGW